MSDYSTPGEAALRELVEAVEGRALGLMAFYFGPGARVLVSRESEHARIFVSRLPPSREGRCSMATHSAHIPTQAVLFAPHNDDETLFAFFQLLRYKPKVIVVLRSFKEAAMGGPDFVTREAETDCAMRVAGCEWEQREYPDTAPDWREIGAHMADAAYGYDTVICPAREDGGHEHHNAVEMCVGSFVTLDGPRYLTYKRGHGRSTEGTEVVPTPEERALKELALCCYESQMDYPPTAPWFGDDQREHLAS